MLRKILSIFLLLFSLYSFAEHNQYIGLKANSEIKSGKNIYNGFGFTYEFQFSKNFGFETEVIQRNDDNYIIAPIGDGTYQTSHILEKYISIFLLYKYYSRYINLSTGLNYYHFVGWKDITRFGIIEANSYIINPKSHFGWIFNISKTIPLNEKFYLEPELHFNPIFKYKFSYYGVGLKIKYKL